MVWLFLHLLVFAWLNQRLYRHYKSELVQWYYWPALGLKIAAGIGVGLLYFFYYGHGDVFFYHADASSLASLAREAPAAYVNSWLGNYPPELELYYFREERALLTAKIFSLFYLFTNSNYWISTVWIAFLGFLASFHLVARLLAYRPFLQKVAPLAFLFWPSHVFWTSGLLKESLAMICIAYMVATALPAILGGERLRGKEVLIASLLAILLFYIKYYYAALLVPFLLCLLAVGWLKRWYSFGEWAAAGLFFLFLAGGVGLASLLHPNLYASRFLEVWVNNYYLLANASAEGSFIAYPGLKAEWSSVLSHAPKAVFAGLFAPLFSLEWNHPLKLVAAAENALLLLFSFFAVLGWLLKKEKKITLIFLAVLGYVLVFSLFMGIAAPNYGSLLRYRISYHPFFVLLVLAGVKYFIGWSWQRMKSS